MTDNIAQLLDWLRDPRYVGQEAADALERLEARAERAEAAIENEAIVTREWKARCEVLQAERDYLAAFKRSQTIDWPMEIERRNRDVAAAEARAEALQAERDALEKAAAEEWFTVQCGEIGFVGIRDYAAMQARAEKAEAERDEWKSRHDVVLQKHIECCGVNAARAEAAETRLKEAQAVIQFIHEGYDNQDVNHVDYRVKAFAAADDYLSRTVVGIAEDNKADVNG